MTPICPVSTPLVFHLPQIFLYHLSNVVLCDEGLGVSTVHFHVFPSGMSLRAIVPLTHNSYESLGHSPFTS
jgi:hypothetical protein